MAETFSIIGISISLCALLISFLSYRRSGRANAALNEFRDVSWDHHLSCNKDGQLSFKFENTGTTIASDVRIRLVRANDGQNRELTLNDDNIGRVRPGESRTLIVGQIEHKDHRHQMMELFEDQYTKWTVHWKSPLGTRDSLTSAPPLQLF